jgi:hypothetical protein
MKTKNYFLYLSFIALISIFAGFTSCGDDDDDTTDPTKAVYTIDGSVVSSEDGTPIEGIEVIFIRFSSGIPNNDYVGETAITNREGYFRFQGIRLDYSTQIYFRLEDDRNIGNEDKFSSKIHIENLTSSDFEEVNKKGYKWSVNKNIGNIILVKQTGTPTEPGDPEVIG